MLNFAFLGIDKKTLFELVCFNFKMPDKLILRVAYESIYRMHQAPFSLLSKPSLGKRNPNNLVQEGHFYKYFLLAIWGLNTAINRCQNFLSSAPI